MYAFNRERNIWREKYIKGKATIRQRSLISHLFFFFDKEGRMKNQEMNGY